MVIDHKSHLTIDIYYRTFDLLRQRGKTTMMNNSSNNDRKTTKAPTAIVHNICTSGLPSYDLFCSSKKKKKNVTTYLRIKERKNLSNILKIFINKLL